MQSRNKREGLYCGTFYANGNPPKKTYRCPYGQGRFITLKEYGKRRKADREEFRLSQVALRKPIRAKPMTLDSNTVLEAAKRVMETHGDVIKALGNR